MKIKFRFVNEALLEDLHQRRSAKPQLTSRTILYTAIRMAITKARNEGPTVNNQGACAETLVKG